MQGRYGGTDTVLAFNIPTLFISLHLYEKFHRAKNKLIPNLFLIEKINRKGC